MWAAGNFVLVGGGCVKGRVVWDGDVGGRG